MRGGGWEVTFDIVNQETFLRPFLIAPIVEFRACVVELVLVFGGASELQAEDGGLVGLGLLVLGEFFDAWCIYYSRGQRCPSFRHRMVACCSPLEKIDGKARPDTPVETAVKAARRRVVYCILEVSVGDVLKS